MSVDYERVRKAIGFLEARAADQPDLDTVAREVGLSRFHFQRLFRQWAGISPKRFLQFVNAGTATTHLLVGKSSLEAAYASGLSGPGRLHDLTVAVNAATPGEIRSGGKGLEIRWGLHPTPLGDCLLAITDRGICELAFLETAQLVSALTEVRRRWPAAHLLESASATGTFVRRIFNAAPGGEPLTLLLKGTNFQLQVWRALLDIPPGQVTTYGAVAQSIGKPRAARAVGSAVGANRIAVLVPCHRVIRGTAAFGGYRWGIARKKALIAWEQEERHSPSFTTKT